MLSQDKVDLQNQVVRSVNDAVSLKHNKDSLYNSSLLFQSNSIIIIIGQNDHSNPYNYRKYYRTF